MADSTELLKLLFQPTVASPTAPVDSIEQLLAIGGSPQQTTSAKVKAVVTTKAEKPRDPLPSQTKEGQAVISETTEALDTTQGHQSKIAATGRSLLEETLGRVSGARQDVSAIRDATIAQTNLQSANKVAVAKANSSASTRYNKVVNDPVRNDQLDRSMAEANRLQAEIEGITSDNSITGVFQQLFMLPGKRKDLQLIQNSNLKRQQSRAQAATNYFSNRQANTAMQDDFSAEEARTISNDMITAQAGYKEFLQQGEITDKVLGDLAASANLNSAESASFTKKMQHLAQRDALTLGGMQAALEESRLELSKASTDRILAKQDKESLGWQELEARFQQFNSDTNSESGFTSIEALIAVDPSNPVRQRFNAYQSRTSIMSNQKSWTERLIKIQDGSYSLDDPKIGARDRQMQLIIEAKNAAINKANQSGDLLPSQMQSPLDVHSSDPAMIGRIDEALAFQFKLDNLNVEDAIDQGRVQFVALKDALTAVPEEEWRIKFPELDEADLKFIKEGGMDKLPTAITQRPVQTVNSMLSTMAQDVRDLPVAEAKNTIQRQSRILAGMYRNQLKSIGSLELMGLENATLIGVSNFKAGDTLDSKFELTSASDWAIRATSAYVEGVRAKKLGAQTSILQATTRGL